jgi:hypothetical protein
VQRAEDQVAGERRADGDFGGLLVADFADHDDVGVLAQDVAQGRGEGEPDLGLDVCTWLMPGISYSIGSSTVMMRWSMVLISCR